VQRFELLSESINKSSALDSDSPEKNSSKLSSARNSETKTAGPQGQLEDNPNTVTSTRVNKMIMETSGTKSGELGFTNGEVRDIRPLSPLESPKGTPIVSGGIADFLDDDKMNKGWRRFTWSHSRHREPQSSMDSRGDVKGLHFRVDRLCRINVGGKTFVSSLTTLTREPSMFSGMLSGRFSVMKSNGDCMCEIDRDPTYFPFILNYLRDGTVYIDELTLLQSKMLLQESEFYQIEGLACILRRSIRAKQAMKKREITNEKEYKLLMNVASRDLSRTFRKMTLNDGYDFESWIACSSQDGSNEPQSYHMVFSKKLSRGEVKNVFKTLPKESVTCKPLHFSIYTNKFMKNESEPSFLIMFQIALLDRLTNNF